MIRVICGVLLLGAVACGRTETPPSSPTPAACVRIPAPAVELGTTEAAARLTDSLSHWVSDPERHNLTALEISIATDRWEARARWVARDSTLLAGTRLDRLSASGAWRDLSPQQRIVAVAMAFVRSAGSVRGGPMYSALWQGLALQLRSDKASLNWLATARFRSDREAIAAIAALGRASVSEDSAITALTQLGCLEITRNLTPLLEPGFASSVEELQVSTVVLPAVLRELRELGSRGTVGLNELRRVAARTPRTSEWVGRAIRGLEVEGAAVPRQF